MKPYIYIYIHTRHSLSVTVQSGPHYQTFRYATFIVFRKLYFFYESSFYKSHSILFKKKTFQHVLEWSTLDTTFICLRFISLYLCVHSVYCLHFMCVFVVSCFIVLSLLAPFTLCFSLSMVVTNFSWSVFLISLTCQKERERDLLFRQNKNSKTLEPPDKSETMQKMS